VDLKKAKNEIYKQKDLIEKQNAILEASFERKKRKTIDLFGKHIDLKKAQKEIAKKNDLLEKLLVRHKQKTLDLFGKHIDLKKAQKEIIVQNGKIEKQNKSITDSIKYAGFIQSAVMPREEKINKIMPEHMILNLPRDIVSGDFYWADQFDSQLLVVVADCTGHGVPGAFMSMLGISLLNELIIRNYNKSASEIMEVLRDKVIFSLHQTGQIDEAADGMDLAFCKIDMDNLSLQFAGAHNPLYIVRGGELIEIKGDRMPIGFSLRMNKPFTNNVYQLEKKDKLYMFSDGYADQFGGENGMKMRYKLFQQYILESVHMRFDQQKEYMLQKFNEWKGSYNQIDDIIVMGFQVQ
jgi:serine phosphatase RsbU (regulator of sigma subunit)